MKVLRANSVEELLSILEKQYGPDWYNKITVRISEIADQVEATVEPVQSTDTSKALESIALIKVKSVSLPELSDLEAQHAEPFISVNISEDKMAASILVIPGFQRILPTVEEIKQALAEAKVVYGIDEDAIEQIIREQKIFLEVPVAFGKNHFCLQMRLLSFCSQPAALSSKSQGKMKWSIQRPFTKSSPVRVVMCSQSKRRQ